MKHPGAIPYASTIIILFTSGVQAARRGRGGTGFSFQLDMDDLDNFVFAVLVASILIHLILATLFTFNKHRQTEKIPLGPKFNLPFWLATALLIAYYSLFIWSWTNDNRPAGLWDPLTPAAYGFMDLLPRTTDILIYFAVLALLRWRRDAFMADNAAAIPENDAKLADSPFYRLAPLVMLGGMVLTTFIRFVMLLAGKPISVGLRLSLRIRPIANYLSVIEAFKAMGHMYLAFYILLAIVITFQGIILWSQVKRTPSTAQASYDQYVFRPLIYVVIPALVVKVTHDLVTHIILYDDQIWISVNRLGFQVATLVIQRVLYLWVFWGLLRLGYIPRVQLAKGRNNVDG